jgi:adenine-specific DNA-methyltransferase
VRVGTTAYVAEQWGRRWITIDTSRVALALARQRIMGAKYPMYLLADSDQGKLKEAEVSGTPRAGGASTNDIRHGFVYERVQHITLKSIANNPDIVEGMTRDQIDAAIKKHADFETLYDRPYEDKSPSASPVRSPSRASARTGALAFASGPRATASETGSERAGEQQPDAPQFEASILENLDEGRHPERPQGGADRVRVDRAARRHLHPGRRHPEGHRRTGGESDGIRCGSGLRSARSTAR